MLNDPPIPSEADWSFDDIRRHDAARADRLEHFSNFDEILRRVIAVFKSARSKEELRIGIDTPMDGRKAERAILQIPVCAGLFDAFFNSRGGLRAEYWRAPRIGRRSEARLISALLPLLNPPATVTVRRIKMGFDDWGGRVEQDTGETEVSGEFLAASLGSSLAKVYICERLIDGRKGPLVDLRHDLYSSALRLSIPRWPTARAPIPRSLGWIDWKGAFLDGDEQFQLKPPEARASDLHRTGSS